MSIPNIGEWVEARLEDAAYAFIVNRRTRKDGKAFLWSDEFKFGRVIAPAEDCETTSPPKTDIEWANMAIALATDEVALEIYAIFLQAYSAPEEWRREVWKGLTPENRVKIQRFVAIAQGKEVAA